MTRKMLTPGDQRSANPHIFRWGIYILLLTKLAILVPHCPPRLAYDFAGEHLFWAFFTTLFNGSSPIYFLGLILAQVSVRAWNACDSYRGVIGFGVLLGFGLAGITLIQTASSLIQLKEQYRRSANP